MTRQDRNALQPIKQTQWRRILSKIIFGSLIVMNLIPSNTVNAASNPLDEIRLNFKPNDSVLDPNRPVIYFTDTQNKKLHAINFETKQTTSIALQYPPDQITFSKNELYITLVISGHIKQDPGPPTPPKLVQKGAIAIIDSTTLAMKDQFEIDMDPYDIAVDRQGAMYVSPWSSGEYMQSFSRQTKQKIADNPYPHLDPSSSLEINSVQDTLYVMSPGIWHSVYKSYTVLPSFRSLKISGGTFLKGSFATTRQDAYTSPPTLEQRLRVSSNGSYVFNSSGAVFDGDLNHMTTLDSPFQDIAFDLINHRLFTSYTQGNQNAIKLYHVDQRDLEGKYLTQGLIFIESLAEKLHYQKDKLIMEVTRIDRGTPYSAVQVLPLGTAKIMPPLQTVNKEIPDSVIPLDFAPRDTLLHPEQPLLYLTDTAQKRLLQINYLTGETKSLQLDLPPEHLAYDQGELFVTLLKSGRLAYPKSGDQLSGAIAIIDTEQFKLKEQFNLAMDPFDIAIDDRGNILVTSGTVEWGVPGWEWGTIRRFSRVTHELLDKSPNTDLQTGYVNFELNPNRDQLYFVGGTSSSTLYSYLNPSEPFKDLKHKTIDSYGILSRYFRVSEDGEYIFNASGYLFDKELNNSVKLNTPFSDIAFNGTKEYYTASKNERKIYVTDYPQEIQQTLVAKGFLETSGFVETLYHQNSMLIGVSRVHPTQFQYFLEVHTLPTNQEGWQNDNPSNLDPALELQVVEITPSNGDQAISADSPVRIRFNQPIKELSMNGIYGVNGYGNSVGLQSRIDKDSLVLGEGKQFLYDMTYTFTVPKDKVSGLNGKTLTDHIKLEYTTSPQAIRLGGNDRYETSLKISQQGWKSSHYAVLATGEQFPDALSAVPLAKKYQAPILLTETKTLSTSLEQELTRLGVQEVFIVGGEGAVSKGIEERLIGQGFKIVRLAGQDRYQTSLKIARQLDPSSEVFIATGKNFPDTLSVASYAAQQGIPILLSPADALPDEVQAFVQERGIQKSYLVGGEAVLSRKVEQALPYPERIAGNDRYETNYKVLARFQFDYTRTFLATGTNFPDALSGAALAGISGGPIVLVSENAPQEIQSAWSFNRNLTGTKYILGGTGVVTNDTVDKFIKTGLR